MHWINTISIILLAFVINAEAYGLATTRIAPLCNSIEEVQGQDAHYQDQLIPLHWHRNLGFSFFSETSEEAQEESECGHGGSAHPAARSLKPFLWNAGRYTTYLKDRIGPSRASTPIFILNQAFLN